MKKNTQDYFKKQLEYKSNIVGQDFHTQVKSQNHVCVSISGEIVKSINFDAENQFIQWEFRLPDYWELDNSELLEYDQSDYDQVQLDEWNRIKSITQTVTPDTQKTEDGQLHSVAHYCFPFDLQLQTTEVAQTGRFPSLLMQVNSLDSWDRNKIEGYGFLDVPNTPGFHQLTIQTYKPNDDVFTRIYEYFLGGAIKIKEFDNIANSFYLDSHNQKTVINRYSLSTESAGEIVVRMNVSIQKESFKFVSRRKQEMQQKMELFQKLRDRRQPMQGIQTQGLPTALMKTDLGYINRFNNTNIPFS